MKGKYRQLEIDANYFALCLLMPEEQLKDKCQGVKFDLSSDEEIIKLSKLFGVSITAMTIRLFQLKLLNN
ncbi:MAG: ImmA/IrrE family metallo-endopeptidase [Ferruginibacter sp.]